MVYNTKGCLIPNTNWITLERTILTLWNRRIQANAFSFIEFKFDQYTCRRRHLKSVVFLQYLISCKIRRLFGKIPKKCIKLHNLLLKKYLTKSKMKNDLLFFKDFRNWLISKPWTSQIKSSQKNILTLGKMYEKKKRKKEKEKCKNPSFWLCMDFIFTNFSSFSGK